MNEIREGTTFGPQTSHLDLAEAIEKLHNSLNERNLAELSDLELLSETATRLRNFAAEDPDEGPWCEECGLHSEDGHMPSCSWALTDE